MASPADHAARMKVIAHVDLDAFYTQVELQRDPSLQGKPLVVVQYNPFGDLRTLLPEDPRIFPDSNGSIIAVSYEARACGVKRNMMAQQAKAACPDLVIVQVPVAHGKADLTVYRDAGAKVMNILSRLSVCERASIDEAYLDVTSEAARRLAAAPGGPQQALRGNQPLEGWHLAGNEGPQALADWWAHTSAAGSPEEQLLAAGAAVVAELRAAVYQELHYSCSAGIAHYKILAKLGSGLHKPRQQTLVPASQVPALLGPLPIPKLRQLGGKFGEQIMGRLGITTVGELAAVPLARLEAAVGEESAAWLLRLSHGVDEEEVKQRLLPKSCSCGKTFRGSKALDSLAAVEHWLLQLGAELQERLEADRAANQRLPQLLTVTVDAVQQQAAAQQTHQHRNHQQHRWQQPGELAAGGGGQTAAPTAPSFQQQQQQQQGAARPLAAPTGSHDSRECDGSPEPAWGAGGGSHASNDHVAAHPSSPAAAPAPGAGGSAAGSWRAGVQTSSRSCAMGRPTAGSMAAAALSLVRRWAADRPPGWRIVSLFLSASNFTPAPTGASTLVRYLQPKQQPQHQGAPPNSTTSLQHPQQALPAPRPPAAAQQLQLAGSKRSAPHQAGSQHPGKRRPAGQAALPAYMHTPHTTHQDSSITELHGAHATQQQEEQQQQQQVAQPHEADQPEQQASPPHALQPSASGGPASAAVPAPQPSAGDGTQELPASLECWLPVQSALDTQLPHECQPQHQLQAAEQLNLAGDAAQRQQQGAASTDLQLLPARQAVPQQPILYNGQHQSSSHASTAHASVLSTHIPAAHSSQQHPPAAAGRSSGAGSSQQHNIQQQQQVSRLEPLDESVLAELPYHMQLEIRREREQAAVQAGLQPGSTKHRRRAASAGSRPTRRSRGSNAGAGGSKTGSIRTFFRPPGP